MNIKLDCKESGSTLAVVIATLATLMIIVAVAIEFTTNINRETQRTCTLQTALAVGDSAIEVLFNSWRSTCRSSPTTTFTSNDFSSVGAQAVPTPSPFPNLPSANFVKRGISSDPANDEWDSSYTISNYKVVGVNAEYTAVATPFSTPEPQLGQLSGNVSSVSPTTSATWNYIASADVTLKASFGSSSQRNVVAKVRRVFSKQQLSPWNWALFYVDPLEIHPGPQFTITGWVHTNSDLYTGHDTLTFADKVTYGSDWFVGFMPGDGQHSETPEAPNYPNNLPPARDQVLQPFGLDSSSVFNTNDVNPNNDSYAELIQPPVTSSTDPLAGERYWDQASVIIRINSDNSVSIGYPNPFNNYQPVWVGSSDWRYTMFNGAISTNQTMQDNREGTTMHVSTLDISAIETGGGANPNYKSNNFNGVVYIYDPNNTTSSRRAIRLKNGSKIPNGGLTVASNNPVYIQGDFNTGGTGSTVPSNNPSNLNSNGTYVDPSNPPSSTVSGYNRAPCSIIADALNLLSNSWNDANSGSVPDASPTTYNVAVIAGIVPTASVGGDGSYSGGAENFPRFLEDWSNKSLTYYGSMVELYKSQQSIGEWGKANVYVPPTRQWYFDSSFKMNPPPGSLMLYTYSKGRWFVL